MQDFHLRHNYKAKRKCYRLLRDDLLVNSLVRPNTHQTIENTTIVVGIFVESWSNITLSEISHTDGDPMCRGQLYRITAPTIALERCGWGTKMFHIPRGAIITIQSEPSAGSRLVEVLWDARAMMMFTLDLRQRGELVMSKIA